MRFTTSSASAALGSLLTIFALLLGPRTAAAQPSERTAEEMSEESTEEENAPKEYRFELGFVGGVHIFAKEHGLGRREDHPSDISPATGFQGGLRLTLNFNPYVGVEAEVGLIPTKSRDGQTGIFVAEYRGSLIINMVAHGPFRPFVLLGVGGLSSIANDPVNIPAMMGKPAERLEADELSDQDMQMHAGLGFKIYFGERAGLRIDGIIGAPPAFMSDVFKVGDETGFGGPDFEILGAIFFNFGEVEKSSKKLVYKKEVVMVAPPPKEEPPPDPDSDGIAGAADKCPNVAEDRDGFQDEDGCPEDDNDADGIPDARDKCPMQPESRNGIDDEDGCPEDDGDKDGFIGSRDKCPDAPETVNGFKDDDGCPDELPPAVKKFTGVIEGINFKTASAEILPGSFAILDRAVGVLKEYQEIKLEISGHTDNRGSADYNRDLSHRRAESVRQYLILKGIASDRLTAVGYGFDRPIADNDSEYGRSRNRRTEFRLVTGDNK